MKISSRSAWSIVKSTPGLTGGVTGLTTGLGVVCVNGSRNGTVGVGLVVGSGVGCGGGHLDRLLNVTSVKKAQILHIKLFYLSKSTFKITSTIMYRLLLATYDTLYLQPSTPY